MDHSLATLLARAKAGDKLAEEELFGHLLVRFETFAKRKVREQEVARDIAQDTCLTVLQKYKTETFTTSFMAWAHGVLKNKIGNHYQKRDIHNSVREPDKIVTYTALHPDYNLKMRLISCLRKMVKKNRDYTRVLNLVYQGYKTGEICHKLQMTPNNCYVVLSRSRRLLKTCMEEGVI